MAEHICQFFTKVLSDAAWLVSRRRPGAWSGLSRLSFFPARGITPVLMQMAGTDLRLATCQNILTWPSCLGAPQSALTSASVELLAFRCTLRRFLSRPTVDDNRVSASSSPMQPRQGGLILTGEVVGPVSPGWFSLSRCHGYYFCRYPCECWPAMQALPSPAPRYRLVSVWQVVRESNPIRMALEASMHLP